MPTRINSASNRCLKSFFIVSRLFRTLKHFVSHRETSRETVVSCIFVLFICIKRLDIVYICVALCTISSLSENLTVPVVMGILKIGLLADLSVSSIAA